MGANSKDEKWELWRAIEVYIRCTQNSVMLEHTMRFVDAEGKLDPSGPLATLLRNMRAGGHIPDKLFKQVVTDRSSAADPAVERPAGSFLPERTLHIAPGWMWVAPMNLRCAQHFAAANKKLLFIIPAHVEHVPQPLGPKGQI